MDENKSIEVTEAMRAAGAREVERWRRTTGFEDGEFLSEQVYIAMVLEANQAVPCANRLEAEKEQKGDHNGSTDQ